MGISETITAAMIGALATVSTALFQLFTIVRARNKVDSRPKRGTATRSVTAILALMVASAAGGFLYSEFIKQRAREDMRGMRQELQELKELIAAQKDSQPPAAWNAPAPAEPEPSVLPAAMRSGGDVAESVVYVPACRSGTSAPCEETDAQRIALCGTVPAFARIEGVELFVQPDAVQDAWEEHRAQFEQDLGGARFTGASFEYAQSAELKAVCVNFMHWSSERPHIARILVQYGYGEAPAPVAEAALEPELALEPTVESTAESMGKDPTPAAGPQGLAPVIAADVAPAIVRPASYREAAQP